MWWTAMTSRATRSTSRRCARAPPARAPRSAVHAPRDPRSRRASPSGPPTLARLALSISAPARWQLEEVFHMSKGFEGAVSHELVQEDVGNTFDVRVWTARPQVAGRDGPPAAPDGGGVFSRLKPNCQYRLECKGTRKKKEVVSAGPSLGGAFANVKLRDEDSATDQLCTCQVGKICPACAAVAG
eukprot:2532872-Prymnesium_polylepis.2